MNRKIIYSVLFLLFFSALLKAQDTAHLKAHIGFMETFFGDEQDYQVCYPKDHKNMFYGIIIFALTSISLGALIIIIKTRSNKLLREKNAIIEEKNHDLVSSITYAKRIQSSILPHPSILNILENKMFVFYKPRDIVSGDFYWIFQTEEELFVSVVDCTGHGVPGAFLSLIGYQGINKAVKEDQLTDPTSILDSMNTHVKNVLQQEENTEIRDGMEVALCKLNLKTKTLQFAGANLNVVLIQNNVVNTIKGSKCTVGSVQPHVKTHPVTHTIQLNEGDAFYCFSDGYADQIGGEKDKKYMAVRLKELLTQLATKSPKEQLMQVQQEFQNWKGNNEQTDDVCMIGVKI